MSVTGIFHQGPSHGKIVDCTRSQCEEGTIIHSRDAEIEIIEYRYKARGVTDYEGNWIFDFVGDFPCEPIQYLDSRGIPIRQRDELD